VRLPPFHCTIAVFRKLLPFTVNVNAAPPANAELGDNVVNTPTGVLTKNVWEFEIPPPGKGFDTVTEMSFAVWTSAAVIAAVNLVALTNVVARALPCHWTTELLTKLVPFTVSVNAPVPALVVVGDIDVIFGNGLFTVNVTEFDVPPPGAGFVTVTPGVLPGVATSPARITAVNCVALTNVVARAAPPKFTVDVLTKLVPFTVNVNPAEPATILFGESVVTVGTGFGAAAILKLIAFDVPPPGVGFVTVTGGVLTVVMSLARIAAVNCVALTNVVTRPAPLKFTTEFETNPVPVTVNVNAPVLTVVPVGESVASVGSGLFTVNVAAFDVPPTGAGLKTVIEGVPVLAMSAAVIAAVICVADPNVVTRGEPLKFTTDVETKFVPFTVSVNPAEPASAVAGEIVVIVGTGFGAALILKLMALDVPPPGVKFTTVIGGVPAAATSLARIAAVSCVALTNVVTRAVPLKFTVELAMKPVPFTVSVSAPEPETTPVGESEVITGAGLFTVKFTPAEVPPPGVGLTTVIGKVPAVFTSPARIAAVSCVELTNVVVRAVPLKSTTDEAMNPVPFTVIVNAPEPNIALVGAIELSVGAGLFTLNVTEFDVPPPGVGLVTVTGGVPVLAMSVARIDAVNCVALTNVVTFATLLKLTTEVETKPVPFTVRVNAGPPTIALAGDNDVIAGVGFAAPTTVVGSLAVLFALPGAASPGSDTTDTFVTLGTAACATATVIAVLDVPPLAAIVPPPNPGDGLNVQVTTWPAAEHAQSPVDETCGDAAFRAPRTVPTGGVGATIKLPPPDTNVNPVGKVSVMVS
jgi:hypothetical protein